MNEDLMDWLMRTPSICKGMGPSLELSKTATQGIYVWHLLQVL